MIFWLKTSLNINTCLFQVVVCHPYDGVQLHSRNRQMYCANIISTLRPRQNDCRFADDIFEGIFLKEIAWISIRISLKFFLKGKINKITALVKIMAWRRTVDNPLSEPMMVSLLTHICVTLPQWVNTLRPRQRSWQFHMHFRECHTSNFDKIQLKFFFTVSIDNRTASVQIMARSRTSDTPLYEPMLP